MDFPINQHHYFLSPEGNDAWTGRLEAPAPGKDDGPFATLSGALSGLRRAKTQQGLSGPAVIWARGGHYPLFEPLRITAQDYSPLAVKAYPGERPVFSGGERISGWRAETVHGKAAWAVDLPDVKDGRWYFRSLFVNGARRPRARLPKVGIEAEGRSFYRMEAVPGLPGGDSSMPPFDQGQNSFTARAGEFQPFHNLNYVEVVALHFWIEERMPVAGFDPQTRLVTAKLPSVFRLTDDYQARFAIYYIDNVFEGLSEPGEWYLDRAEGRLYYLPVEGETPETAEVYAPRALQFLIARGEPEAGRWVDQLSFEGLTFEHTDWVLGGGGWPSARQGAEGVGEPAGEYASSPQAATRVGGMFVLEGARNCSFERCTLRHLGGYGIQLGDGCQDTKIIGCEISDLGAGGIHVNGADAFAPRSRRTSGAVIRDNLIADGGKVFHSAVGVLLRHTFGSQVEHNHIHHFFYTGISCGWVWGYAENVARDNRIAYNHIHDLGFGWLSDMGGIYILGVQPGTVLYNNLIHDVEAANYGGWAIYPDEGSAHLVIENNICFNVSQQPFHQHYGRENIVRNNIFAFGQTALVALSRAESHRAFTFSKNILVTCGQPVFAGGYGADLRNHPFGSDLNLFWSADSSPLTVAPGAAGEDAPRLSFAEWQALGFDRHSIVQDPGFVDLEGRNFTLKPGSSAFSLGFAPIDLTQVGPRETPGAAYLLDRPAPF